MTLATMFNRRTSGNNSDHQMGKQRNPDVGSRHAQRRNAALARASRQKTEYLRAVDEYFADEYWLDEYAS